MRSRRFLKRNRSRLQTKCCSGVDRKYLCSVAPHLLTAEFVKDFWPYKLRTAKLTKQTRSWVSRLLFAGGQVSYNQFLPLRYSCFRHAPALQSHQHHPRQGGQRASLPGSLSCCCRSCIRRRVSARPLLL